MEIVIEKCKHCGSETANARISADKIIPLVQAVEECEFRKTEEKVAKEALDSTLTERNTLLAERESFVKAIADSHASVTRLITERNNLKSELNDALRTIGDARVRIKELEAELALKGTT